MKFRKVMLILASCVFFATLAGCNGAKSSQSDDSDTQIQSNNDDDNNNEEETPEEVTTPPLAENPKETLSENQSKEDGTSDIHVVIETVDISLEDLQAQNYVVPVMITLDENAGITYSEWGAVVDSRCTFTADKSETDYSVYYSINEERNFMWTAWTSGAEVIDNIGSLLKLEVTVPSDAKVGDKFEINYQSMSLADKAHIWNGGNGDWVKNGYVTWVDGGINIVE